MCVTTSLGQDKETPQEAARRKRKERKKKRLAELSGDAENGREDEVDSGLRDKLAHGRKLLDLMFGEEPVPGDESGRAEAGGLEDYDMRGVVKNYEEAGKKKKKKKGRGKKREKAAEG